MSYCSHIYRWANFKTTVGRRPNIIEYLKNTTAERQTYTYNQWIIVVAYQCCIRKVVHQYGDRK